MEKKFLSLILLLLLIGMPVAGTGQNQKEVPAKISERKVETAPEPEGDFPKAGESFLKKDLQASADAIRKAAAYFMKLQEKAEEAGEKTFQAQQEGLSKLAGRVVKGFAALRKEIDQLFKKGKRSK